MTDMDWSTLASTAVGGILALAGGFVGQWWGERRAVEREHRIWARDQRARSYDATRLAYTDFLGLWDRHVDLAMRRPDDVDFQDWDWAEGLPPAVSRVTVFGTAQAAHLANTMVSTLLTYAFDSKGKAEHELTMADLNSQFLAEIREDLGVAR